MKDSISRWSLHYEGWAAEHNISCLPRGNRSRGKGLSLLSPCRGGAPPFSPALPSYSVSLLFLLFAPAVTKPHSGRFSSAFRPFCSANPAAGSRNMQRIPCLDTFKVFSYNGSWLVMLLEHIVHPISSARKSDNSSNVYGFHAALSPCIAYKQSIPVQ